MSLGALPMMFCFRLGSRQVSLSVNKSSLSYDCHIFYKSFQKYDLMFQGSWGSDVLTLSVYSYKSTSFPLLKSAGVGAVLLGFLRYLFSWWKAWKDSLTAILWMFERPQNILSTASEFFSVWWPAPASCCISVENNRICTLPLGSFVEVHSAKAETLRGTRVQSATAPGKFFILQAFACLM